MTKNGRSEDSSDGLGVVLELFSTLSSILPAADKISALYKGITELHNRQRERRISLYCNALMNGDIDHQETPLPLQTAFEVEFGDILDACMQDSDTSKAEAYAQLTIALRYFCLEKNIRRHFINTLKQISFYDLELLRRAYFASKYEIIPENGYTQLTHAEVFDRRELGEVGSLSINILRQAGLISDEMVTKLGRQFVECTYKRSNLSPDSIGWKIWRPESVVLIESTYKDPRYDAIIAGFKKYSIRCSAISIERLVENIKSYEPYSAAILIGRYDGLTRTQTNDLVRFSEKKYTKLIVLDEILFDHSLAGLQFKSMNFEKGMTLDERVSITAKEIIR